ncbi:MAG: hypothetical protein ACLRR4_09185 [Blautia sp.]
MDKKRNALKIPKWLWFWNKKTKRRILRGEPFSEGVLLFFAAEKDTFRIWDKSLGRYRKSLPKEGISLYNDSDYNRKVTIQSPISIPLTLHLDVASRHMKRKKTAHSCKHDSQFSSILHGSE